MRDAEGSVVLERPDVIGGGAETGGEAVASPQVFISRMDCLRAGVELGEVLKIDESGDTAPRPIFAGRALKAEAVPIERGTGTLEATVSVAWALK